MQKSQTPPTFSKQQENDIREVVFRYHMAKLPTQFRFITRIHFPEIYFLSVNNTDPSPTFLACFCNDKPAVKPLSAVKSRRFEVFDKTTGKQGVILFAGKVRQVNDTQVKVETSWRTSGRGGTFGTCLVEKQKNGWVVIYYAIRGIA